MTVRRTAKQIAADIRGYAEVLLHGGPSVSKQNYYLEEILRLALELESK